MNPEPPPKVGLTQLYEPIGSWIGGNRDRKRLAVATTLQAVFSTAAFLVAASTGPVGWVAIAYFVGAGAAANVAANAVAAEVMGDSYGAEMALYDATAGGVVGLLPGLVTASVWVTAGARVTLPAAVNLALNLSGAGPALGNGVLRDRVFQ